MPAAKTATRATEVSRELRQTASYLRTASRRLTQTGDTESLDFDVAYSLEEAQRHLLAAIAFLEEAIDLEEGAFGIPAD